MSIAIDEGKISTSFIYWRYTGLMWYALAQLVEALRYKPEGRGIDSR
jgi:hypothetical protein